MLSRRAKGEKLTYRKQLEAVAANSVAAASLLDGLPTFPTFRQAGLIWSWFTSMDEERPSNGMAISALSSGLMLKWAELHQVTIEPWAARMLRRIDSAFQIANGMTDEDIGKFLFNPTREEE